MKKQLFMAFLMLFCIGIQPFSAQKHRNHLNQMLKNDANEVIAFSDTTGTDSDAMTNVFNEFQDDDANELQENINTLSSLLTTIQSNTWGIVLLVIGSVIGLLFICLPIIIFFLLIRFLLKKSKQKEKYFTPTKKENYNYVEAKQELAKQKEEKHFKNGIFLAFTGIGTFVMLYCLGAKQLIGVGILIFFMGLGNMGIYLYFSKKRKQNNQE